MVAKMVDELRIRALSPATDKADIMNNPEILPRIVNAALFNPNAMLCEVASKMAGPGVMVAMNAIEVKSNQL